MPEYTFSLPVYVKRKNNNEITKLRVKLYTNASAVLQRSTMRVSFDFIDYKQCLNTVAAVPSSVLLSE